MNQFFLFDHYKINNVQNIGLGLKHNFQILVIRIAAAAAAAAIN